MIDIIIFKRKKVADAFSLDWLADDVGRLLQRHHSVLVSETKYHSIGCLRRLRILKFCWMHNARVFHVFGDINFASLAFAFPRRPNVVTIADVRTLARLRGIQRFLYLYFWILLPVSIAARVVVFSMAVRDELLLLGDIEPDKIVVIPCHLHPIFELHSVKKCIWEREDKFRILHIGTTGNKNFYRHLAALSGLNVELVAIGNFSHKDRNLSIQLGVKVDFVGNVDIFRLVECYMKSSVLLFCSTYEGFGLPIIEAQAMGLPVITSAIPPLEDIAGGAALLVDPLDTCQIRSAVVKLMESDEHRDELRIKGYHNAKSYSGDIVINKYLELYKEYL